MEMQSKSRLDKLDELMNRMTDQRMRILTEYAGDPVTREKLLKALRHAVDKDIDDLYNNGEVK